MRSTNCVGVFAMSGFFRRTGSRKIGFEKDGVLTAGNLGPAVVGEYSGMKLSNRCDCADLFDTRPNSNRLYEESGKREQGGGEYTYNKDSISLSRDKYLFNGATHTRLGLPPRLEGANYRNKYSDGIIKRAIDIIGSAAALVFLLPLMFAISGLVKLSSPGPVFFHQVRRGRGGKPFNILKFRTMVHGGSAPLFVQAQRDDARITPLGAVLRRYSLDELPQLINVLKGDMSLIGPRPHAVEHDEKFRVEIPSYDRRYSVRPGITGLAQVSGLRGPTPTVEIMRQRVAHDVCYVKNASLRVDLWIYAATLREIVSSKTAY